MFETRVNAFALSAFRDGLFEVMDEGSQLVAELVAPPPGGRVVDACAGAGGKTLALGAALAGKGRVLALDTDGKKLEELRRRARRAGLTNVEAKEVKDGSGRRRPRRAVGHASIACWSTCPARGWGRCAAIPRRAGGSTRAAVDGFPARQLGLLVAYAPLCAVGGRLIYATCTVDAAENERVVERFLRRARRFRAGAGQGDLGARTRRGAG